MSKKHHEKQLARARAKRAARKQATRRRNRVVWAVLAAVVVLAAVLLGTTWLSGDDEPTAAVTATPTATSTATAAAVEPCPVPTAAPTPDTSLSYASPPPASDAPTSTTATIATTCGDITVSLDGANAPQAVASFLFLAEEGYYDGTPFHRVMADFVIQGGDPTGTGTGGPGYAFEDEVDHVDDQFESVPGPCAQDPERPCFAYPRGTLAMANSGPDTNGSQFFVVQADPFQPWPPDYTPFGSVVDGMDVVDRIANGPVEGPGRDQAVDPTVITSIDVTQPE